MTTITKGRHVLGKLSRNCDKTAPRNCEAALTWELRDNAGKLEFTASGEVWNHLKTDTVWGGQCVGELAALFPRDKLAQRIAAVHAAWHLNGMNAGTPEQSAHLATLPDDVRRDYEKSCKSLAAAGLLEVPVTDELRASALGGLPEGATVYRYGSRWLYRDLPADVVALIRRGFRDESGEVITADPEESGEPDRDLIAEAGLSIAAEFVPFSKSRNAKADHASLNWRVTVLVRGREVLTCDYSKGSAHCPAYGRTFNNPGSNPKTDKAHAIRQECETGRRFINGWKQGEKIAPPTVLEVLHSLLLDSSALDSGGFDGWCSEFGYDSDSIKARETFDACLDIALKLRGAVGAAMFDELRSAAQ